MFQVFDSQTSFAQYGHISLRRRKVGDENDGRRWKGRKRTRRVVHRDHSGLFLVDNGKVYNHKTYV
jgi:hypothetical protein